MTRSNIHLIIVEAIGAGQFHNFHLTIFQICYNVNKLIVRIQQSGLVSKICSYQNSSSNMINATMLIIESNPINQEICSLINVSFRYRNIDDYNLLCICLSCAIKHRQSSLRQHHKLGWILIGLEAEVPIWAFTAYLVSLMPK